MTNTTRIGCASGFYGDSQLAARQLIEKGDIDYLVFDYLAEITMSILAKARAKNEDMGYAVDFVTVVMRDVLADCAAKGIKVVANAGGVNVPGCIAALESLCKEQNLNIQIGGVFGDDLQGRDDLPVVDMGEMQSGVPLPENLASMNAYLGARPIADALAAGADVVVTGRVVDSAVILGPLIHELGWKDDDYDQLAQGSLCGHVLECGAQCTGGNHTDWQLVPDFSDISYPIADVSVDGSFVVGIPKGTGGIATVGSVGEQILYEIGDPANYLLPDVACDFSNVRIEQLAKDQVRVTGAKGRSPGGKYKVCATWRDGFMAKGAVVVAGLDALGKAKADMNAWVSRIRRYYSVNGIADFRDVDLEYFGAEHTFGSNAREAVQATREVVAKFGVHHDDPKALQFALNEMAYLGTSGTPGMYGITAGRSRPSGLMRIHSTLLEKSYVPVSVQVGKEIIKKEVYSAADSIPAARCKLNVGHPEKAENMVSVPLEKLSYGRSGDKGNNANIGIMARDAAYLPYLQQQLTASAVKRYFSHLIEGEVERFELPGMGAYNFFITEALGGGGAGSLRGDCQAKSMAQQLLSMEIDVPAELLSLGNK